MAIHFDILFFLIADGSKNLNRIFHTSGIVLAFFTPLAFMPLPDPAVSAINISLGVLLPIHSHVGLNYVISDYVPKAVRGPARGLVLAITIITAAGLLKLNLQGPGLSNSIISLGSKKTEATK